MPEVERPTTSRRSTGSTPIGLALGEDPASTIATAIETVDGLDWLPEIVGEIAVATAETKATGQARIGARIVAAFVHERGGRARVVTPPRSLLESRPLPSGRDRWIEAGSTGGGARIERVPVLRELIQSPATIGCATIGASSDTGPLAIGLWRRFVHPRLAIPARFGGHRSPLVADLAAPFRPRLLVLIGRWRRHIVVVATPDLIAAELAGLAIRHGATTDPADRPRPWEDPLVQRATELGLGVLHPSSIDLRLRWAGPPASPSIDALPKIGSHVAEALGLR